MPPLSKRIVAFGRHVMVWDVNSTRAHLRRFDPWAQQVLWQRDFAGSAQFWLVDSEEIGVMDPAGTLVVLALGDSRENHQGPDRGDEVVGERRGAALGGPRYVLIASSPTAKRRTLWRSCIAGKRERRRLGLRVRRASGKRLWVTRIPNQTFSVQQASGLPVLTFLRNHMKQSTGPNAGFTPESQMLCLDTHNGRILHQNSVPGRDLQYEMNASPSDGRLEIHTSTQTVTFRFGGKAK